MHNFDYFYIDYNPDDLLDYNEAIEALNNGQTVIGVESKLLISDNNGVYIPKIFYENFNMKQWLVDIEKYADLNNPDLEQYWDLWNDLLSNASYTDDFGKEWLLHQDGHLFAIHVEEILRDNYENI